MKIFLIIAGLIGLGLAVFVLDLWYRVFINGELYKNADILQVVIYWLVPVGVAAVFYYGGKQMKKFWSLLVLVFVVSNIGCSNYAHSSVQTVITTDCGVSWKVIAPGQAIPRAGLNYCFRSVTIPDYPMQGESNFKVNFANDVKVSVDIDYDYSIVEPIAFLSEAKYVGNQNASEDKKANDSGFETAENSVIDKRIKDIVKNLTQKHDIVDFDQSAFEDELLPKVNEVLKQKGVELRFLTFVTTPDVQTNQAIDAASAMRVYRANGLEQVGIDMMKARAGATQLSVQNQLPAEKPKSND